jgi:hypothetical protein
MLTTDRISSSFFSTSALNTWYLFKLVWKSGTILPGKLASTLVFNLCDSASKNMCAILGMSDPSLMSDPSISAKTLWNCSCSCCVGRY